MLSSLKSIGLISTYFLIFFTISVGCNFIGSKGKLKFVHVIYRHGDRTPVALFPNASTTDWPEGLGQLTNEGVREQYYFGQWLYQRYHSILGNRYHRDNIYVRSTDMDRTIESALANMAGMFPPNDDEIWNRRLNWQPIAVHTVDMATDYLMGEPMPTCPAYTQAYSQQLSSPEYQKLINDAQPLFQYLSKSLGYPVADLIGALVVYDTLFVMKTHNKPLPAWSKSIYPGDGTLEKLVRAFYASYGTPGILAKLRSGFLLKEILDRCTQKSEKTLVPDRSMYQYSAHDSTVANMLNALGLYTKETPPPPYASSILFELREFHNETFIELYYKDSTKTPSPIYIPNCGYSCPLKKMYQLYDSILPKYDFQTECNQHFVITTPPPPSPSLPLKIEAPQQSESMFSKIKSTFKSMFA